MKRLIVMALTSVTREEMMTRVGMAVHAQSHAQGRSIVAIANGLGAPPVNRTEITVAVGIAIESDANAETERDDTRMTSGAKAKLRTIHLVRRHGHGRGHPTMTRLAAIVVIRKTITVPRAATVTAAKTNLDVAIGRGHLAGTILRGMMTTPPDAKIGRSATRRTSASATKIAAAVGATPVETMTTITMTMMISMIASAAPTAPPAEIANESVRGSQSSHPPTSSDSKSKALGQPRAALWVPHHHQPVTGTTTAASVVRAVRNQAEEKRRLQAILMPRNALVLSRTASQPKRNVANRPVSASEVGAASVTRSSMHLPVLGA
jgi:hypothetical protein